MQSTVGERVIGEINSDDLVSYSLKFMCISITAMVGLFMNEYLLRFRDVVHVICIAPARLHVG